MSAIALVIRDNDIHFYSDGMGVSSDRKTIVSRSLNKIHMITDSVGYLWAGFWNRAYPAKIKHIIQAGGLTQPAEVAGALSQFTSHVYRANQAQIETTGERILLAVAGIGFQGCPEAHYIDSKDSFDPSPMPTLSPGKELVFSYAFGSEYGFPQSQFDRILSTYKKQMSLQQAGEKAFSEMCRIRQEAGVPVGGQIFSESLTSPEPRSALSGQI